jgi:hypothetical protein
VVTIQPKLVGFASGDGVASGYALVAACSSNRMTLPCLRVIASIALREELDLHVCGAPAKPSGWGDTPVGEFRPELVCFRRNQLDRQIQSLLLAERSIWLKVLETY